jgi:hypothetical protein
LHNVAAGAAKEGGSTITQQLVRLTYLSPERAFKRKVQEAMLALWLERQLPKQEILVRYLNAGNSALGSMGSMPPQNAISARRCGSSRSGRRRREILSFKDGKRR